MKNTKRTRKVIVDGEKISQKLFRNLMEYLPEWHLERYVKHA
jgi:hypothetical protein